MATSHTPHIWVRPARAQDLSAMATILYEAMPLDPQWNYRFPLRMKFPVDNYGCTCQIFSSALQKDGVYINAVTFPSPCLREDEEVPAAVAIWEVGFNAGKGQSTPTSASPSSIAATSPQVLGSLRATPASADSQPETSECRRDANFEHMNAFTTAIQSAKKTYFDSRYQSHHLHLRILATHPNFQRRGAGSALCRWGMEHARARKEPVTLFASPMGQKLYTRLEFDYLGTVPVQVEGEDEKLSIGAMIYPYNSDETYFPPPACPNDGAQKLGSGEWYGQKKFGFLGTEVVTGNGTNS